MAGGIIGAAANHRLSAISQGCRALSLPEFYQVSIYQSEKDSETKLAYCGINDDELRALYIFGQAGPIKVYTENDALTWIERESFRSWTGVASSADGKVRYTCPMQSFAMFLGVTHVSQSRRTAVPSWRSGRSMLSSIYNSRDWVLRGSNSWL